MDKTMAIEEFQKNLEQVLEDVTTTHVPYILTRNTKPLVVVLAYEDYVKILSREEVIARFDEAWMKIGQRNAQYSEEEVAADLELATREIRERRATKL